ncbi:hypothetical protein [Chitinolyticbacter albus]|uniref:hypothetical protein n=1 Tax=Chitinolyticbacter albus TaxID=2961951 RepID=UPI00210CC398|nr:hypothetical protein [Chitinolyticbacter albus]
MNVKTMGDYLDAAKAALGIESDYALAKRVGVSHGAISNYRAGFSKMDDYAGLCRDEGKIYTHRLDVHDFKEFLCGRPFYKLRPATSF